MFINYHLKITKIMNKKFLKIVLFLTLLVCNLSSFAQVYAGIEIGSKGVKMSIIDVDNIKKGDYVVKEFWTENCAITKGVAKDGNLALADIDTASAIVLTNYNLIKSKFNIPDDNIFLVGSSGVAMAKNTQLLINKVKVLTNKDLEFIDAATEGKMLLKGCVPPVNYGNSMVLDIGGGNTKGGYIDVANGSFVFFPIWLDYGSVTLTETIVKKTYSNNIGEYIEKLFGFLPTLRSQTNAMYATNPQALEKESVYLTGGAVWAFYTLTNGAAKENFSSFKLDDVLYYDAILKYNYGRFVKLAETDENVKAVLATYTQKHLIAGSNILQVCLEAIPNINEKKLYFAKEGKSAWLVSYIADRSRRVKKF